MKVTSVLLSAILLAAASGTAQVLYTQPFNNSINATSITTISGWNWAASDGGISDTVGRQFGRLSNSNGIGGASGFAYNSTNNSQPNLAALTWYNGDTFLQSTLDSLSVYIGHNNAAVETRFVIQVDGQGWFATTQAWTTAAMTAGNFPTQATPITFNFTTAGSAWRSLAFDGLVGDASTGFPLFSGDQSANALLGSLPVGNITAVGVYHFIPTNTITRYDNFTVTAIPEPSTYAALFGLLALGLVAWRRRR